MVEQSKEKCRSCAGIFFMPKYHKPFLIYIKRSVIQTAQTNKICKKFLFVCHIIIVKMGTPKKIKRKESGYLNFKFTKKVSVKLHMKYSVRVFKNKNSESRVKGYTTIVLNNAFILKSICLVETQSGDMRISMPARVINLEKPNKYGRTRIYRDRFFPIRNDVRIALTEAAIKAYETDETVEGEISTASDNEMSVSVTVKKIRTANKNIKAVADVVFDNSIVIRDIRLNDAHRGEFIGFPAEKKNLDLGKVKYFELCHPVTKEFSDTLTGLISDCYAKAE